MSSSFKMEVKQCFCYGIKTKESFEYEMFGLVDFLGESLTLIQIILE